MDLIIRTATEDDFEEVGRVFADELKHHVKLLPKRFKLARPIMTQEWYLEKLANPDKVLLLAELDYRIVGVALVLAQSSPKDPIFRPRRYAYLDELGVLQQHRGQGIGRRLMEAVHQWAKEKGLNEIELNVWENNTKTIEFYEKLGYKSTRRTMSRQITE